MISIQDLFVSLIFPEICGVFNNSIFLNLGLQIKFEVHCLECVCFGFLCHQNCATLAFKRTKFVVGLYQNLTFPVQ